MKRKTSSPQDPARRELQASLDRTRLELRQAYAAFDLVSDPDLTESCIYEIRALQARTDYLLRQLKGADSAQAAAHPAGRSQWI